VAVAVHPDLIYVKVRQGDAIYYLIKDRLEAVTGAQGPGRGAARTASSEMVGWEYTNPHSKNCRRRKDVTHRVIPWKEVSTNRRPPGIVHIAPGCGKEDYELGKEFGLPAIAPIDEIRIVH